MQPKFTLYEGLAKWDRVAFEPHARAAAQQRTEVLTRFPLADWPTLPLDRYALGLLDPDTFCRWMEFRTPELGGIGGGSSKKHIIFRRANRGAWVFDKQYENEQQAWVAVRAGFVRALDLAGTGDFATAGAVEPVDRAASLLGKTLHTYFPDDLLPIYAHSWQQHYFALLGGDGELPFGPAGGRSLFELVRKKSEFDDFSTKEIGDFLGWWADPRDTRRVVKIAPGEDARYWDECLAGGYICVGWDEVGDLREYASKDEMRARFAESFDYTTQSKISAKSNELWTLIELEPGDKVIANKGTAHVLAIGTVEEPGYEWRPERPRFAHTVKVSWDTSFARDIDPVRSWATVTVAKVPNTVYQRVLTGESPPGISRRGPVTGGPAGPGADVFPPDEIFAELMEAMDRKGQLILYGPPGTGKTWTANRFSVWWLRRLAGSADAGTVLGSPDAMKAADRELTTGQGATASDIGVLTRVTFHPSYTYEDFVEGYKPVDNGTGQLALRLTDGVFKRACQAAQAKPDQTFLLVIDEINRGNIPKIFGELITLLELDKRGMTTTLPQSRDVFSVPPNLRIIGTMNTADRSIRLLDAALRRRFAFVELMPDPSVLAGGMIEGLALDEFLEELNRRIASIEGREKQVGHSFLLDREGPVSSIIEFARRFRHEILPLLQDYAYEDFGELAQYIGSGLVDVAGKRVLSDKMRDPVALVTALRESFQPRGSEAPSTPAPQ